MDFSFETSELRDLCEKSQKASRELGELVAFRLRSKLSDIEASASIAELPYRPRELSGLDQFAFPLALDYLLVFVPKQKIAPVIVHGEIGWSTVYRIKILAIKKEEDNDDLI